MSENDRDRGAAPVAGPPSIDDEMLEFTHVTHTRERRELSVAGTIVSLMLSQALGSKAMRRIELGMSFCACVTVPDASWFGPVREAAQTLRRESHVHVHVKDSTARRIVPEDDVDALVRELHNRTVVMCVSQDIASTIPRALRLSADVHLILTAPTPEIIAFAIGAVRQSIGPRRAQADLGRGLTLHEIAACLRPGDTTRRIVARIVRAQAAKKTTLMDTGAPLLEDLAGYGQAKLWGERLCADVVEYRAGERPWNDLKSKAVLYGEPGTGKTFFAHALGRSLGVPVHSTSVGSWLGTLGGDLGGTIKAATTAFSDARASARDFGASVLFIDEIDSLPDRQALDSDRGSWWKPLVNHVLAAIDGAHSNMQGVVVLAATNSIDTVDPALLRPGRLETHLAVLPPRPDDLADIVIFHLGGEACPISTSDIAGLLRPLAGATQAMASSWAAVARGRARNERRPVSLADVAAAAFPVDRRTERDRHRVAVHEAGHAIVALLLARNRLLSTSIMETEMSGGVTHLESRRDSILSRAEIDVEVMILLGGRAAEAQVGDGSTSGAGGTGPGGFKSDLAQASRLLAQVHGCLGLGPTLRYRGPEPKIKGEMATLVESDLRRLLRSTNDLVAEHAAGIRAVADVLSRRGFLLAAEIEAIFEQEKT